MLIAHTCDWLCPAVNTRAPCWSTHAMQDRLDLNDQSLSFSFLSMFLLFMCNSPPPSSLRPPLFSLFLSRLLTPTFFQQPLLLPVLALSPPRLFSIPDFWTSFASSFYHFLNFFFFFLNLVSFLSLLSKSLFTFVPLCVYTHTHTQSFLIIIPCLMRVLFQRNCLTFSLWISSE